MDCWDLSDSESDEDEDRSSVLFDDIVSRGEVNDDIGSWTYLARSNRGAEVFWEFA